MSSGTSTSTSKIAAIVVIVPMLIALWFALPWFLPMWRWQNVDLEKLARDFAKDGYTKKSLETEFTFVVHYNPRGSRTSGDPCPWQIVSCSPAWKSVYPDQTDENELLVRCSVISERDGETISKLWVGTVPEESFFKIKGWRLPPGTFNKPKGRPVIVYDGFSLEKVDINAGMNWKGTIRGWETDDDWEDRDDGWSPPGQ